VVEQEGHRNKRSKTDYDADGHLQASEPLTKSIRDMRAGPSIELDPSGQSAATEPGTTVSSSFAFDRGADRPLQTTKQTTSVAYPSLQSASDLTISPSSNFSQPTYEGDHEQDSGLSNPVRLLAEAAEEGALDEWNTTMVQRLHEETQSVPPQYTLPETLEALLAEDSFDSRVVSVDLDNEYLARGLQVMLGDTAKRSLTDTDKRFFKPARNQVKRDLGSEYDPLDLALVTMKEVRVFFASFFAKLHPMLPVMDPILHTPDCQSGQSMLDVHPLKLSCPSAVGISAHCDIRSWSVLDDRG